VAIDVRGADLVDATLSLSAKVQRSDNGGRSWRDWVHFTWVGHADNLTPPEVDFPVERVRGQSFRVVVDVPKRMSLGIDAEVLT
jgi:hypothetical protein